MPPTPGYKHGFRRPAIRAAIRSGAATIPQIAEATGIDRCNLKRHLLRMLRDGEASRYRPYGARAHTWTIRGG